MSTRIVAVRVTQVTPPGSLRAAMLEDVVDLIAGMQQVEGALVATTATGDAAGEAAWPGMPVAVVDTDDTPACLAAVHDLGADEVALVCADAPDLPALLLGKLFSALTSVEIAVCPAEDGSLVALAARVPSPDWLAAAAVTLDTPDALSALRAVAPSRGLVVGSGWHRVRTPADAMRLDPGLEGWEATREWLAAR